MFVTFSSCLGVTDGSGLLMVPIAKKRNTEVQLCSITIKMKESASLEDKISRSIFAVIHREFDFFKATA